MIKLLLRKARYYLKNIQDKKLLLKMRPSENDLLCEIKEKKLTYLTKTKLANILYTVNDLEQNECPGLFIEAGCALGGSSILICRLKGSKRAFNVYDVFEMIPAPTEKDTEDVHQRFKIIKEGKSKGIKGDLYYGYENDLYAKVVQNFEDFNIQLEREKVKLVKGLVQDTMKISEPVAFAHIDVDWYEPVKTCLEQIWPNLIVGGSIILDDYHDWGGCRKAVDEYFERQEGPFSWQDEFGSLKVTRIKKA